MLELMALADGELEGEARARAEKLAAESDEGRRALAVMRASRLGVLLGEMMAQRTAAADGIADAVMSKLHADSVSGPEVVVRLPYPARRSSRGSRKPILLASALSTLALAAGIAVYIQSRDVLGVSSPVASMPSIATSPLPSVQPKPVTSQSATPLAQEGPWPPGVQVDEIDSPSHDVHVFEIPAGAASTPNASSVVIMIEDEPGSK
jgi:hypothetical protein